MRALAASVKILRPLMLVKENLIHFDPAIQKI